MSKYFNLFDSKSLNNLKRFIKVVLKQYRKQWEISIVLMLCGAFLSLPMPFLTKYAIDNIIVGGNKSALLLIGVMLIVATIIYLLIDAIKSYLLFKVRNSLIIKYNILLLRHLYKLPNKYIYEKGTGYLIARVLNDPQELSTVFIDTSLVLIQSTLTILVSSFAIFFINWKLALLSLAILPFYIISNLFYIKKIKYWNEKSKEQSANITKVLKETLSALTTIKLFLIETVELLRFHKNLKLKYELSKKEYLYNIYTTCIISFFYSLVPITILVYGGYEIINGNFTLGGLIAFNTLLAFLFNPIRSLLNLHISFQTSTVSLNRVYEILDTSSFDIQFDNIVPVTKILNYSIKFENVSFSYENDKSEKVLDKISFTIEENQKIGLVGQIGCGKTTIVNLLNRFIIPQNGEILLGDCNINNIDRKFLHSTIGVVSQDVFLFSGSVYENILIGNIHAKKEDVFRVAKITGIDEIIKELPNKYDTLVGENGIFFSGGQRQLISIARLLLKAPKILILDEPSSAMDINTENILSEIIINYFKNTTIIIISHKYKLIENANTIMALKDGKIETFTNYDEFRGNFYSNSLTY